MTREERTVLGGKYEILRVLGEGGMSTVYLVRDRKLDKSWAVKEISRASGMDREVVVRTLVAEANLMKQLSHSSLPRIVDIFEEAGSVFIVMDYIEGESLEAYLERTGAQPQEKAVRLALQLCETLEYLHSRTPPIVYRDMKPANIMLRPDGTPALIDFGTAREYEAKKPEDTTALGTRGYAAPEQYGSLGQTDPRTDIYGLGATLYHMVTGHSPAKPPYEMYPIREWNSALSPGLEAIILKCARQNPDERYQSCAELSRALKNYRAYDGAARKDAMQRLALFALTLVMSLAGLTAGFAGKNLAGRAVRERYRAHVEISSAKPFAERMASYCEAIALRPESPEAYDRMLSACEAEGRFGEEESRRFLSYFDRFKDRLELESDEVLDLLFHAGMLYFYRYGGEGASVEARMALSQPFLEAIAESGREKYRHYETARDHLRIARFFRNDAAREAAPAEPEKAECEALLRSLSAIVEAPAYLESEGDSSPRIAFYREIAALMQRKSGEFLAAGVSPALVGDLLSKIGEAAGGMRLTRPAAQKQRKELLRRLAACREDINRAFKARKTEGGR